MPVPRLPIGIGATIGQRLFSPTDLSGLNVWLDSANPGVTSDQWDDISGNNNHYTSGSGQFPTFSAAGAYFDGATKYLTGPSLAGLTDGEIFIVLKNVQTGSFGTDSGIAHFGTHGGNNHYAYDTTMYLGFGITTRPAIGTIVTPTINHILNTHIASGTYTVRTHDVERYAGAATAGWNSAPTLGQSASGYYYYGWIKALLIFSRKLESAERIDMHTYLGNLL